MDETLNSALNSGLSVKEGGKSLVADMPDLLSVETTSICNLRCVMCGQAIGDVKRPKHMSMQNVDALKEPLAAAKHIQLHGIGEPLASPSFWKLLEGGYADENADININTNLTMLNDQKIERLVSFKGNLTLNVSMDAATDETYRKIRGAEFKDLKGNLKKLIHARGDKRQPRICVNMTLMRENIEELVRFIELAHSFGVDAVYFWHLNRYDDATLAKYKIMRDGWYFDYEQQGLWNFPELSDANIRAAAKRGQELNLPIYLDQNKIVFYGKEGESGAVAETNAAPAQNVSVKDCAYPWDWALVTSSGEVRPCCYAGKEVGNINSDSFANIWNGATMKELRRYILADRIHPVCESASCKYVQMTPQSWMKRVLKRFKLAS